MDVNAPLRALVVLSDSPQVENLQVILKIKRPLQIAHLCGDQRSSISACVACGYIPVNPKLKVKYLCTNSSDEDFKPVSDADQTWGKFRQVSLVLLSLQLRSDNGCRKPRLLVFLCARRNLLCQNSCPSKGDKKQDKKHNYWHCVIVLYDSRASSTGFCWDVSLDFSLCEHQFVRDREDKGLFIWKSVPYTFPF